MSEQDFNSFHQNQPDEIEFRKFIRYVLMQTKMIIIITSVAFALSAAYYLTSTKIYKISSLLEVKSFNQNILDPTDTLQKMTPGRASENIDNLIMLYKSRTNLLQIISDLNLNVEINPILDKEVVDIKFFPNYSYDLPYEETFYILPANNSFKIFEDEGENLLLEANYGQEIEIYDQFNFSVESVNLQSNRLLEIKIKNPVLIYKQFKATINVDSNIARNAFLRSEGLIEVSYLTPDIDLGKRVVDYANKVFIEQRVLAETKKSRAAINFIEKNVGDLQKIVKSNKEKLKQFKETSRSINLELETRVVIDTIQSIDQSLNEIEIELADASKIYTKNNPIFINLNNRYEILSSQKEDILAKIQVMPKEQQEYIDLFNQVETTQDLFAELEARRLGFSILEASTIGDIRVVDNAFMAEKVSPSRFYAFMLTIIAFLFSLLVASIRGHYFLPISNPGEVMDNGIFEPMVGVIPFDEAIDNIDLNSDTSRYKASMESAIINIRSLQDEDKNGAQIICLTSPTALNGKSTTSKKLSETLSFLGNKVLLIDADFKRGGLGKDFNIETISERTFFDINSSNLDRYSISDNLYLIPRVKGLQNSFHFICDPRYPKIFQELKNEFDYIIFDTAPLLSVADTSVIMKLANINLLVLRHEITKIRELKQAIDMYSQINVPINGYIYNAYAKPTGYYGYYRLYRNYAYAYYSDKYLSDTYDYKKEV
ncbi:MAG: AAA family ATPase [Gammaproteobacteria bacterium]